MSVAGSGSLNGGPAGVLGRHRSTQRRIARGRDDEDCLVADILDIARTVFGAAWASARSKNKKPALTASMEQAFAAGDPPVGVRSSSS